MFKKTFLFTLITSSFLFYSAKLLAGGIEIEPIEPQFAGIYLEANIAYAYRPWRSDSIIDPFNAFGGKTRGGFSTIDGIGYQFNEFTAIEASYIYLPHPKGEIAGSVFSIDTWAAYAAGKLMIPVCANTYLFGKLGAAYTSNHSSMFLGFPGSLHNEANFWSPMFAFGGQYYYSPNVSVSLQYMHIPGYHGFNKILSPTADIVSLSLSYKFLM